MTILMTSNNNIQVFDRSVVRRNRERARPQRHEYSFLQEWSDKQLSDRLCDIKRTYEITLQIGSFSKSLTIDPDKRITMDLSPQCMAKNGSNAQIVGDEEFLPFAKDSLDCVISSLCLHSVNDLPGTLIQIRNSLKPDGLFLASILGGQTLHELRQCLMEAELSLLGGAYTHIFPFVDMPQLADLMQRAGFSLPVVDFETLHVSYENIFSLMKDIRGMGEGNSLAERSRTYLRRDVLMKAAEIYAERFSDQDGRITASFDVLFMIGWAPAQNQQQPLRPGSAEQNLAEWLGTEEFSTHDKAAP